MIYNIDMDQTQLTEHEAVQISRALQVLQMLANNPRMTQKDACAHVGISVPTYKKWIATQDSALITFEQARQEIERNEFAKYLVTKSAISDKLVSDAMKPDVSITERIKALEFIEKKLEDLSNRYHTVDVEAEQELLTGPQQELGTSMTINRVSVEQDGDEVVVRVKDQAPIIDMTSH